MLTRDIVPIDKIRRVHVKVSLGMMFEKRDCVITPVSNCLLYDGNLIESCRSLTKGRREHTALQGMTLFLTWQSAELNSRPLTRRQSPLKEGSIHQMAGGLFL